MLQEGSGVGVVYKTEKRAPLRWLGGWSVVVLSVILSLQWLFFCMERSLSDELAQCLTLVVGQLLALENVSHLVNDGSVEESVAYGCEVDFGIGFLVDGRRVVEFVASLAILDKSLAV